MARTSLLPNVLWGSKLTFILRSWEKTKTRKQMGPTGATGKEEGRQKHFGLVPGNKAGNELEG